MSLEPMKDAISTILERLGISEAGNVTKLLEEWADLAGPPWDTKAVARSLRNKELIVEVPSGTDATLLRYQVGDLLKRLDETVGEGVVETVRIRVARGAAGRHP